MNALFERPNNSNEFLRMIDKQYEKAFAVEGAKIGSVIRIQLPNDWMLRGTTYIKPIAEKVAPVLTAKEVVVIGAASIVANNPKVTRRFWSWFK